MIEFVWRGSSSINKTVFHNTGPLVRLWTKNQMRCVQSWPNRFVAGFNPKSHTNRFVAGFNPKSHTNRSATSTQSHKAAYTFATSVFSLLYCMLYFMLYFMLYVCSALHCRRPQPPTAAAHRSRPPHNVNVVAFLSVLCCYMFALR